MIPQCRGHGCSSGVTLVSLSRAIALCCIISVSVVLEHHAVSVSLRDSVSVMGQSDAGPQPLGSQIVTLPFASCVTLRRSGWFDQETYFRGFIRMEWRVFPSVCCQCKQFWACRIMVHTAGLCSKALRVAVGDLTDCDPDSGASAPLGAALPLSQTVFPIGSFQAL